MAEDLKERIRNRWERLKVEREPWLDQWLEISQHITPASGRFLDHKRRNQARDRWNRIYDNTATRAANVLAAGLMSGMTDPSSQWFALTTGTPSLDESYNVKSWLDQVQRIMEMAFSRTNVYQALHHGWREVGVYGTSACVIIEDPELGFHCYPLCCGEYCIANNHRGQVDTLYRKFTMTAAQLVGKYGRKKMTKPVLDAYDNARYDEQFDVLHAIEPRFDRDPTKLDNKNMPYRSVIMLVDGDDRQGGILEESGYKEFPAVVGRWGASAVDTYSEECPGIIAIGDTLQLQHYQLQKGNAVDYQVDPPLILPTSAKNTEVDFLPGGRSFIDAPSQSAQVHSAFNVNLPTSDLRMDIQEAQQRINQAFSVDMFLMLANRDKTMTATEVSERHEEKLMMLGPVLSRLNNEILRPLIDRTFNILLRNDIFPPIPDELQGQEITVQYTSMLARSQRAIRANSLDQMLSRVGQIAQMKPEVLNKLNGYALVDEYADYFNVAPSTIVPTDQAEQMAAQQAQAQQQQAQAQMAMDAVKTTGNIPSDGSTMGGQLVNAIAQGAGSGMEGM